MRSVSRLFALVAALTVLPAGVLGQGAKTAKVDEASLRTKLLAAPYVEGKLSKVEVKGDEKELVLTYTYQTKKQKTGYNKYAEAVRRYNSALNVRSTSLEDIKKLRAAVDDAVKDAYDIDEIAVSFDLKIGDKTPIRFSVLPPDPDGSPKVMSAAQLAKLKGDPRLPGYTATLPDLNKTDVVRVFIDKKNIKKSDDGTVYPATMIVIVPTKPEDEFKPISLK